MSLRFSVRHFLVLLLGIVVSNRAASAQDRAARRGEEEVKRLSPAALEPLVAGIALYPDPLVKDILSAATTPPALRQASHADGDAATSPARLPESVRALQAYPEVLEELQQHWLLTVRLGIAYRQQPGEVWAAIERVRTSVDALAAAPAAPDSTDPAPAAIYANSIGVVMGRLLSPAAVAELQPYYAANADTMVANRQQRIDTAATKGEVTGPVTNADGPTTNTAGARYSQLSQQQVALANHAMSQSWSQLDNQLAAKKPAGKPPRGRR